MEKKLSIVWLAISIVLFSSISVYAADTAYDNFRSEETTPAVSKKVQEASRTIKMKERERQAYVQYIRESNGDISTEEAYELVKIFETCAEKKNLNTSFLIAIARTESDFRKRLVSSAGARGIMQIMPETAKSHGVNEDDLFKAEANIDFGSEYISEMIKRFSGDKMKALSAYNQGPTRVSKGTYSEEYAVTVLAREIQIKGYTKE